MANKPNTLTFVNQKGTVKHLKASTTLAQLAAQGITRISFAPRNAPMPTEDHIYVHAR